MRLLQNGTVSIPTNWSSDQARAVCDILEDIIGTIWQIYEHPLRAAALRADADSPTETMRLQEASDDNYPF